MKIFKHWLPFNPIAEKFQNFFTEPLCHVEFIYFVFFNARIRFLIEIIFAKLTVCTKSARIFQDIWNFRSKELIFLTSQNETFQKLINMNLALKGFENFWMIFPLQSSKIQKNYRMSLRWSLLLILCNSFLVMGRTIFERSHFREIWNRQKMQKICTLESMFLQKKSIYSKSSRNE